MLRFIFVILFNCNGSYPSRFLAGSVFILLNLRKLRTLNVDVILILILIIRYTPFIGVVIGVAIEVKFSDELI